MKNVLSTPFAVRLPPGKITPVFGFLVDRVGRYQLEEFYDCSYLPLQRILPDIVTEERGHIEYGYNKTLELIVSGDEGKAKAQKAVDYWYVRALDMFGRADYKSASAIATGV